MEYKICKKQTWVRRILEYSHGIIFLIKAILPFIFMSNALVLGVYEGFWGHYWLMKEIDQKRNSITRL
jgi:hypothetical protein